MTTESAFNLIFARIIILLKPHIVGLQIIQFRPKEVGTYRPIVLAVDNHGLANVVPREIRIDDTASSKFIPNTDFFGARVERTYCLAVRFRRNYGI